MKEEIKNEEILSEIVELIEIDEENKSMIYDDIYALENASKNFYYYKIDKNLMTKEDLFDLLNDRWLSDRVRRSFIYLFEQIFKYFFK